MQLDVTWVKKMNMWMQRAYSCCWQTVTGNYESQRSWLGAGARGPDVSVKLGTAWCAKVHRVAGEIIQHLHIFISPPTADQLAGFGQGFCDLARSPAFKNVVGAIDGCHIHPKASYNVLTTSITSSLLQSRCEQFVVIKEDSWMSGSTHNTSSLSLIAFRSGTTFIFPGLVMLWCEPLE